MFDDGDGVTLETVHGITVVGNGGVTFDAPQIELASPEAVDTYYAPGGAPSSCMEVTLGSFDCTASEGQCYDMGQNSTPYDPMVGDEIEEGKFDWGGLISNVIAAVAIVAFVAVISAATFGTAAPVLIAGGLAIAGMARSDWKRGNVSSQDDYVKAAFIASATAFVSMGLGSFSTVAVKAAQNARYLSKVMPYATNFATGVATDAAGQWMRGENIDLPQLLISGVSSTVGGVVSRNVNQAIRGGTGSMLHALLKSDSPVVNSFISGTSAFMAGSGTNFVMQLANMAVFGDGIDLKNVDWQSVWQSGVVSLAQDLISQMEQDKISKDREEMEKRERQNEEQFDDLSASDPELSSAIDSGNAVDDVRQPRAPSDISNVSLSEMTDEELSSLGYRRYSDGSIRNSKGHFVGNSGTIPGTPAVRAAENILKDEGNEIIGNEISVRGPEGTLRRYDIVARSPDGTVVGVEVKSGSAVRTIQQKEMDEALIRSGGFNTVGQRANDAGIDRIVGFRLMHVDK
jgi:hypothetical protein